MVGIIRIIRDGKVLEETENLQEIYEKLIVYDRKVKEIEIRVGMHK